ncbi:MAG: TRAM domain-containing protein, partial [Bacteroidia bacterium]|nr:TRAM domain-containing protein [Bacteroidia bacterium]
MKSKIIENVKVVDIADKGKTIGKLEKEVFLIDGAVPGDLVDVEVKKKRKSMWLGRVVNTREFSEDRVSPFCSHFEHCGGCKWQHLSYEAQLHYKEKRVRDAISKIAGLPDKKVQDILAAPEIRNYR